MESITEPLFYNFVKIYVSRAGNSNHLRLRDNRNNPNPIDFDFEISNQAELANPKIDTDVERGNVIIWELDPRSLGSNPLNGYSPIKSIDRIVQTFEKDDSKYKDSEPILTNDPEMAGNAFVAIVQNLPPGKKFTNYMIEYTLPDDTKHVLDPKIQLNA